LGFLPTVENKAGRFRKANRGEQLAQLPSIRLFFLDFSVPVVQRIEQGFPKGKTPLLHQSADVISSAQIAVFKPVELLLGSSRVIRNVHIFTHPGDTNFSTILLARRPCPRTRTAVQNNLRL